MRLRGDEIVLPISFYDRQEFHFMTDKFHLMSEPTMQDGFKGLDLCGC